MALRDLYARYLAMNGRRGPPAIERIYPALAVEAAVEKQLGLRSHAEIEAYGVGRFVARCDEFVARHSRAYGPFSRRMGLWWQEPSGLAQCDQWDRGNAEASWTTLSKAFDAGRLAREERVVPYCPRCRTALGSPDYRPADGQGSGTELAVTVRLALRAPPAPRSPLVRDADLLVWTPPWRLLCAAGVAVHPRETYVVARRTGHDDRVVVSEAVHAGVLGPDWAIASRMPGTDLAGLAYQPAFPLDVADGHRIIPASFVRAKLGTGLALLAGAFGTSDYTECGQHNLPIVDPLGPDGRLDPGLPLVGGKPCAAADDIVAADLADRGLLFASQHRQVRRRLCGGCGVALLWRARPVWLLDGEVISRTRFLGLPLPIWECPSGHLTCPGSIVELSALADRDLAGIDPRRPELDAVVFDCPQCSERASRVVDVADRSVLGGPASSAPARPALARPDEGSQVGLGAVTDAQGRIMAARTGTTMEPLPLIEHHGADAVRWFIAAGAAPSAVLRMAPERIDHVARRVLLRYLHMIAFWCEQAAAASTGGVPPGSGGAAARTPRRRASGPQVATRPTVDRWALSELQLIIAEVTSALDAFDTVRAARGIAGFVDQLSRWYLRVSRRRFREGADGADAFATLHECLETLSKLMAPIAPFASEYAWQRLRPRAAPDSVHLAAWPIAVKSLIDVRVGDEMRLVRRICALGRAARTAASIALRQPLSLAEVTVAGLAADYPAGPAILSGESLALAAAELNVREIEVQQGPGLPLEPRAGRAVASRGGVVVSLDVTVTPQLRRAGLARAAIRAIQRGRRQDGFAPGEPISVRWDSADDEMARAIAEYGPLISAETHAGDLVRLQAAGGPLQVERHEHDEPSLGLALWLSRPRRP